MSLPKWPKRDDYMQTTPYGSAMTLTIVEPKP